MENEISKHTIKIIKSVRNPQTSLGKKIGEVALEIFVIVFAVSLAQYLERQREESVKQHNVKEFLIGLREDIKDDEVEIHSDVALFKNYKHVYTFLSKIDKDNPPVKDTLDKYIDYIFTNAFLRPRTSRYEGFKSSGKLEDIADKKLLHDILFLYQEALPQLNTSETGLRTIGSKLQDVFTKNAYENKDGSNNYLDVITSVEGRNLCKHLIPGDQLFYRYKQVGDTGISIIKQIDQMYPSN